jgi:hypothetical protein
MSKIQRSSMSTIRTTRRSWVIQSTYKTDGI